MKRLRSMTIESLVRNSLTVWLLIGVSFCSLGQLVPIPDANFRKCLKDAYPQMFSGDLLILDSAKKVTYLDCGSNLTNRIENLSGIQHFTNLEYLDLNANALVSLPDVSALTKLNFLNLNANLLQSLPDLSNTKLGNDPTSALHIAVNYLTFEDLIPVVVSKVYQSIDYSDQRMESQCAPLDKLVGENLEYDLNFDAGIADNTYRWYRDGSLITTTSSNTLEINDLDTDDEGTYTCTITNSRVPGLTLEWNCIILSVKAGYFQINDVAFRECLRGTYPQYFDGDYMHQDSAKRITEIECVNLAIENLEGIRYFTNLVSADFSQNRISIPPDISTLTELTTLSLGSNDLATFPNTANNPSLERVRFSDNHLTSFPDLHANPLIKILALSDNQITAIPDLSYLTMLNELIVGGNPITSMAPLNNENLHVLDIERCNLATFPDLTHCQHLRELSFGDNPQFSTWPNLSTNYELTSIRCSNNNLTYIPPLNLYPSLRTLWLEGNRLMQLPDLSVLTNLRALNCQNNRLTSLPDLSNTRLGDSDELEDYLNVSGNHLTFEDLIPVVDSKSYAYLSYDPQTIPAENIRINKQAGEIFSYGLGFDSNVPDNTYQWYKDNIPFTSDGDIDSNVLLIRDLKLSHAGVYRCLITNGRMPNLTLQWSQFDLNVSDNPDAVTSLSDPVISPNNDGVADHFYIPHNGISKIYDRNGVLVNELQSPGAWDGTDRSGTPVPMGTYVIVNDGQREIFITIVR